MAAPPLMNVPTHRIDRTSNCSRKEIYMEIVETQIQLPDFGNIEADEVAATPVAPLR